MTQGLIGTSLKYRFLAIVLAAVLIVAGTMEMRSMPVDTLPEFAPPYIEVQTEALGLSASEVETLISMNLESLLNGTPWLQTIRSRSVPGLSSLLLIFEPGTDVLRARQLVEERLGVAHNAMPNVSKPPVILQPLSATSRVMMIGLTSKDVSPIALSVLTRWNIRPALMSVSGVANVSVWGMRERQLQVLVDPAELQEKGVTLQQIIETSGNALWVSPLTFLEASTTGSGGWIDTPNQRLGIRHLLPISTAEELAQVVVAGETLRLGEVATVVENHQPLIGDAVLTDVVRPEDAGLILVVEKFPGSNTLEVTRGVEERLNTLRPGLTGIEIDTTLFRPATFLEIAISNLTRTVLITAILLVALLLLLFFDWRAALISIITIPLSILTVAYILYRTGATMNTMVLAGIVVALGVILDDVIVDVDAIKRRLQTAGGSTPAISILAASQEMRSALLYAGLLVVIVTLPILLLEGVSGAFFRPLVISYAVAVAASTLVALLITPALALILYANPRSATGESPLMRWMQRSYGSALTSIIRAPRVALLATLALLIAGLVALPFATRQSMLPTFQEPSVLIQWENPPGTSHPEMTRLTDKVIAELRAIPGVRTATAHVGRAVLSDQISDINAAQIWVSLDPRADHDAVVAAISEVVEGHPGIQHNDHSYLQETLSQVLTGSSKAVVVRVYGPELDVLETQAVKVREALAQIEGITDLEIEAQANMPEIQIEVDLAKAEQFGLKPGDVRRAAATLLAGIEVGNLFEEQKVFEVVVWSKPEVRTSVDSVRNLLIDTPDGGHVRLGEVASVVIASTPNTINREAVSRRIDIGFNVAGRSLSSVMGDVEDRLKNITFALEYHPEVFGEFAEQQNTQRRVAVAAVAALIGMFLILQACFDNWRLALLLFSLLPVALVGGLAAAFLTSRGVISLGSLLGFLMVLGVALRNGILLINSYQRLERESGLLPSEIVLRGSLERGPSIVKTALLLVFALLPLVIFGSIPGSEIAYPMALIVLGGLVTSTLLNLFLLPSLYHLSSKAPQQAPTLTEPVFKTELEGTAPMA